MNIAGLRTAFSALNTKGQLALWMVVISMIAAIGFTLNHIKTTMDKQLVIQQKQLQVQQQPAEEERKFAEEVNRLKGLKSKEKQ